MVTPVFRRRARRHPSDRPPVRPRRIPDLWLAAAALMAACWAPYLAAAGSLTAHLEPDSIQAGETATLTLTFTDCGNVSPPQLPEIPNCEADYRASGSQFKFINGAQSSSILFNYALRPKKEGDVAIPGFTVNVGGQNLSTEPLVLHVGKGFDVGSLGRLKIIVPRTNVWVGETFRVEVRFYFRQSPAREEPPTLKLDGFVKGKQTAEAGQPEKIDRQTYSVAKWTMAVTAVKAGDLQLGPAEMQTIYAFQSRRRSRGGPFDDPFFGQFFGGVEQRQIGFASDPVQLRVESPPAAGRPAGYAGNVGAFEVRVEALTNNVTAGDPITLRVRVSGRGDFDQLRLPDFPAGSGLVSYPGSSSFEAADALGLQGVKTFEQVVTPETPSVTSLQFPPVSWWNPDTGRYETARPPAIPITVRPGAASRALAAGSAGPSKGPSASATPERPQGTPELGRPKNSLGALATLRPSWVLEPWFFAAAAAPPVAALVLVLAQRRAARPRDDSAAVRARAEAAAEAAAARMREAAGGRRGPEFFEAMNEALQRRIALCTAGAAGSFTEEIIDASLTPAGLDTDAAAALRRLFVAVAQARFSQSATSGELDSLLADTETALTALRRLSALRRV